MADGAADNNHRWPRASWAKVTVVASATGKMRQSHEMNTVDILGFRVVAERVKQCAKVAHDAVSSHKRTRFVACVNPHSIVLASGDKKLSEALRRADLLLPDGVGVVVASRMLGRPVAERIAGMDFFCEVSKVANETGGYSYFFLGSTEETLARIALRMARDYPHVWLAGTLSPPFVDTFSALQTEQMIRRINESGANVLWVGMTAPKQEKWISENLEKMNVSLVVAVGAVFDFYAGTRRRAPSWVCKTGLEWLLRLIIEPRRLWRRTFVSGPLFMAMLAKAWWRRTFTRANRIGAS